MDQIDSQKLFLGLCLIVFFVVAINAGLYFSLRRNPPRNQTGLFSQIGKTARKPWEKEDQALQELSKQVAGLKQHRQKSGDEPENPHAPSSKPQS
jgi:hypothetical protein